MRGNVKGSVYGDHRPAGTAQSVATQTMNRPGDVFVLPGAIDIIDAHGEGYPIP